MIPKCSREHFRKGFIFDDVIYYQNIGYHSMNLTCFTIKSYPPRPRGLWGDCWFSFVSEKNMPSENASFLTL